MPKIKLMRIILLVTGALTLVAVLLTGRLMVAEEEQNVITIKMEDGEKQSYQFKSLCLLPGEECEYAIDLEKSALDKYHLRLEFSEKGEGTLKNFVRMKILSGEETVYDELLASVLEGDGIVLEVDFSEGKNTDLAIVYYLPLAVGNEAKNAEAMFELLLTASNE